MKVTKKMTSPSSLKYLAGVVLSIGFLVAPTTFATEKKQQKVEGAKNLFRSGSAQSSNAPGAVKPLDIQESQKQPATAEQKRIQALLESSTLSDQAFSKTAKDLMPLTPEQIKTLHYLFNKTQQAVSAYPEAPPKPVTTTLNVDLSPGATPPAIRLSSGLVTSLIFLDSTSAPWPVEWYDIGDPKRFNIKADPKGGSNAIMIQALTSYKSANIAIKLKGLATPVMLTLIPGQKSVDYRVDLRVPGLGPNAISGGSYLPMTSSPNLLNVLNGVTVDNGHSLQVSGGVAQAWKVKDKLYIRTRMTVISPGWLSRMTSGDGMNAYELPLSPVVLALDNGAMVSLQIKE